MFQIVKLKKDGWHKKLQMWTFGWEYEYQIPFKDNFCPYFWLTVFCVIASPFSLIIKGVLKVFRFLAFLFEKFTNFFDATICDPLYNAFVNGLSNDEVYLSYKASEDWYDGSEKRRKQWYRWKELHKEDWQKRLQEIQKEYQARAKERAQRERIAQEKAYQREQARKATFLKIIKYTKFLVPVLLSVAGVAILYGLYLLFSYLFSKVSTIPLETILLYLGYFLAGVTALALAAGVVIFLVRLGKKCSIDIRLPKFVPKFFKAIFSPIGSFFSFIVSFVVAYKENNCPAIEWED